MDGHASYGWYSYEGGSKAGTTTKRGGTQQTGRLNAEYTHTAAASHTTHHTQQTRGVTLCTPHHD